MNFDSNSSPSWTLVWGERATTSQSSRNENITLHCTLVYNYAIQKIIKSKYKKKIKTKKEINVNQNSSTSVATTVSLKYYNGTENTCNVIFNYP